MAASVIQLGASKAPVIAFGTGSAHFMQDSTSQVAMALKEGITHLDNAEMYQNERFNGQAIHDSGVSRDKLYVSSKFGENEGPASEAKKPLMQTLKDLQVDYLDLYLLHDPVGPEKGGTSISKIWTELESLKKQGLVKEIGVSNFRPQHIDELLASSKESPVINQIELHPYVWKAAKKIVDHCKAKGIKISAYGSQLPLQFPDKPVYPIAERIAKAHGITVGQVLQKWSQKAGADIIVSTSSKPERIHQMLAVPGLAPLTDAEFEEIATAGAKFYARGFMKHLEKFD